ncbi:MAG: c-type cytochrome [Bryobacteraceae bacterium]
MRIALALASLVIFAVHGFVFVNQFFHRWERHQTAYFDQARTLSKTDGERAALTDRAPRIEQTIVTQFGETWVDRCQTCHIAIDDPRFSGHAQPLKTHPFSPELGDKQTAKGWERSHKFADFGCTSCHGGQGRGLQTRYAHGEDHYWPEPLAGFVTQETWRADLRPQLTGKEYMEANCAQCHTEETFAGTPTLAKGRKLFVAKNCYGCHRIEGISDGTLGPDLTEAGKKFKPDYLWESIIEPRANSSTSFMPKFELTSDEVKALVIFLKSRRGVNLAETSIDRYRMRMADSRKEDGSAVPVAMTVSAERGRQLIDERACLACHKLEDKDGRIAPDLSWTGLMRDEQWIADHFRDPRSRIADSIMPAFRFVPAEFQAMTAYLSSRRTPPATGTAPDTYKALCARCHGDKGDGQGVIAWYLDPAPRDLTKASFMNSKSADRFIASVKDGVPGTSMPPWGKVLSDEQTRGLVEHIYATFVKSKRGTAKQRNLPETNPVAMSKESAARGEAIFVQRCAGCHGRKGDGKGPNSIDIVPHPRNLRNTAFVHSVDDRRLLESILYGVQGTAMPPWTDYGLTQKDVGDVINFIRGMNPAPSQEKKARDGKAQRRPNA